MKLQISYDFTNLAQALEVAKITADIADIIEIGTSLLFADGPNALKAFRTQFPDKIIMADAKMINHIHVALPIFLNANMNRVSILAGATNSSIKHATTLAHAQGAQIMLDLLDAASPGQSAVDATILDIDSILFHKNYELKNDEFLEIWQSVRGNTSLPIFIEGKIDRGNVASILDLKPDGLVIGYGIIKTNDPAQEARYFKELLSK